MTTWRNNLLLFSLVAALFIATPLDVLGHDDADIGFDIIFVIDVSGTMRNTDPNRVALQAVVDVINALPLGASRVGVIGFSGIIQYHFPLQPLDDENFKEELTNSILRFQYVGFTDVGRAFLLATDMLAGAGELNNPMILLLTDGGINISPNEYPRTAADSYADVELAINLLERQVPVYTIGLVEDPDTSPGAELLNLIAELSGGHTQLTNTVANLPLMFVSALDVHVTGVYVVEDIIIEYETPNQEEIKPYEEVDDEKELDNYNIYEPEPEKDGYVEMFPMPDWRMGALFSVTIISALVAAISVFKFVKVVT